MTTTTRRTRRAYNVRCRNKCRSRTLLERTDRYEIWLCTTCDDRRSVAVRQMNLFDLEDQAPAIPEQPQP